MPETPKNKAQIFPNPYTVSCDTFSCYKPAKYSVGRGDGPLNICQNLCDECAKDIMRYLPPELAELVPPPEGKVLVDAAELAELRQKVAELEAEPEPKDTPESTEEFICNNPGCGRVFTTNQALIAHQRFCKGAENK